MKRRFGVLVTLVASLGVLAPQEPLAAQQASKKHARYTLKLLDTLGGPGSQINSGSGALNREGTVVGGADTTQWDDVCGCYVNHAVRWRNGGTTDLGTLPGGDTFSTADSINSLGVISGISNTGSIDPATGAPIWVATLWKYGQVINLGTLGGDYSLPNSINDRSQVVGGAQNTVEDPFHFGDFMGGLSSTTQWHAALWKNGTLKDLGTLGGTGSFALSINERGQVAGFSFSDAVVNPETGFPTVAPFFWDNGTMTNIGSLGGVVGLPNWINSRGQVTGASAVTRDQSVWHAFLWERGVLRDLGTFGGTYSSGNYIDDSGEVVGGATTAEELRAFRWKNGHMTNLGSLHGGTDPCSFANSSNSRGQIVGQSISDCDTDSRAFLWENGGPMVDLNTLIPPGSGVVLEEPQYINERGEIAGLARLPDGSSREFLLTPNGDRVDAASADDLDAPEGRSQATARATLTPQKLAALQARLARRHRAFGPRPSK